MKLLFYYLASELKFTFLPGKNSKRKECIIQPYNGILRTTYCLIFFVIYCFPFPYFLYYHLFSFLYGRDDLIIEEKYVVRMSLYAPPLFHFCFPLLPSNLSSHLLTLLATSYMRCKELYGSNVQHLVIRPPQLQRTSPLERASSRLPAALLCTHPGVYKSSGRTSKAAQYRPATSSSTVLTRTVPLHQTPFVVFSLPFKILIQ
jgi:hypothetical protein